MEDNVKDMFTNAEQGVAYVGEEIKAGAKDGKDKIYQLAREHNLDPEHVEDWPQEMKDKLK